jgi:hypothetical protein
MARTRKLTEQELAEQQRLGDFLTDTHARLRIWRKCSAKACRRIRRCQRDPDKCGERRAEKSWKWVHDVVQGVREGRSRTAALRAAETGMSDIVERNVVKFWWGNEVFAKLRDGRRIMEAHYLATHPPINHGTRFRRLTGRASTWLSMVPGKPKARP